MIQPPLQACRQRKWETLAISFAVVVVVAIPVALAALAICSQAAATRWLSSYAPIVYLDGNVTAEEAAALRAEVEAWPLVQSATLRQPEDAHNTLVARLGQGVVEDLGVTSAMLPSSIVVEPAVPFVGHIDLVARVSGLEARPEVDAVEVPGTDAMDVLGVASVGLGFAALLAALGVFAALVLLFGYLRRLREQDRDLDRVTALFGAYQSQLRRPTLVRGATVGSACGVLLVIGGVTALLGWQLWASELLGTAVSASLAAWSVVLSPGLVVPLLGLLAAWFASVERVQIWERHHA